MKWNLRSLVLAALGTLFTAILIQATTTPAVAATKPLQFTSSGHIVGFTSKDVIVATGSHALRVEFVGAKGVEPISAGSTAPEGTAAPMTRVSYPSLWEGITLAYDAPTGLLRSTYTLAPGADPARIKLRYNAPVVVEPSGELKIAYAAGAMRESAPIAWQDINGQRVAVTVAFRAEADKEVGFALGSYNTAHPLTIDPVLTWNTFLGGNGYDYGTGIAVAANGTVYVIGSSSAPWGTPIRAYAGGDSDAFVAKLDTNGNLLWNTFLGGPDSELAAGIVVDADDYVYVTGGSAATWGNPIRVFVGQGYDQNAFVAKLDTDGNLSWNTFFGTAGYIARGGSIAVDASSSVYVTGMSSQWGNPIRAFSVYMFNFYDVFVAKLDTNGNLLWNTFLGGIENFEEGHGIALDANGNIYISGIDSTTWGNPIRAYGDFDDIFVAKLDPNGNLLWNTFLGGTHTEWFGRIAVDTNGNVFVTGSSHDTWGNPLRAFAGDGNSANMFVAKLDTDGNLSWNTFFGTGLGSVSGHGIAVDANCNLYVTGLSYCEWGTPFRKFSGGNGDAFAAKLDPNGNLLWSTFLGEFLSDSGNGIAVDANDNVYVTGYSSETWGIPIRGINGRDAFVAVISPSSDALSPTGTVLVNNGKAFTNTSNVILYLSAADNPGGSGLDTMRFRNGGQSTYGAWEPYATTKEWALTTGAGIKTVMAQFKDRDGNISDSDPSRAGAQWYSDKIIFDPTPPTGSILINSGTATTATTTVMLSLSATDTGGSGLGKMRFRNSGALAWGAWKPYAATVLWRLTEGAGVKAVFVQYRDKAGNISDADPGGAGAQGYKDTIRLIQ